MSAGGSFGSFANGLISNGGNSSLQQSGMSMFGSGMNFVGPNAASNGSRNSDEDFPALPGAASKPVNDQTQYQQSFGSLLSGTSLLGGNGGFNVNPADSQHFPSLQASLSGTTDAQKTSGAILNGTNSVIGSSGSTSRGASSDGVALGTAADQSVGVGSNSMMGSLIGHNGLDSGCSVSSTTATTATAAAVAAAAVAAAASTSSKATAGSIGGLESKFGLTGLLDIIRQTDKDLNALALGTDLTTFGLNLNSTENLFSTFSSPFTDQALSPDPQFGTPACYIMHPPSLKSEHLSKFQLETLFYMFYSMPKDILQACAAQELYRREWRYHGELKVWLKQRTPQELMQSHPSVQFLYFDCNVWETRLFTAPRGNLTAGLLSEEDVRVKVPQPPQAS